MFGIPGILHALENLHRGKRAAPKNSRLAIVANGIEKIVQGSGAINLLARELLGAGRGLPPEVKLTAPL